MNNLDALLQGLMRKGDPQSAKFPAQSATEGSMTDFVELPDFGALLKDLTGQAEAPATPARYSFFNVASPFHSSEYTDSQVIASAGDSLEPDQGATFEDASSPPDSVALPDGSETNLQTLVMPSYAGPNQSHATAPRLQPANQPSSRLMDLIQPPTQQLGGNDIIQSLKAMPSAKAAVLHQETHFKPITPGLVPRSPKLQGAAEPPAMGWTPLSTGGEKAQAEVETHSPVNGNAGEQHLDQAGTSPILTARRENAVPDAAMLASAVQRIVGAAAAELKDIPGDAPAASPSAEKAFPGTTVKSSDGVVRMLNIQLHPAELGVVTVKMRLAGDQLEMEVHASREETAEILKKDSEKLTGLLRASGYRPDTLTIHVTPADASQPDNSTGQRQQSPAQSHFGDSQTGGQSPDRRSGGEGEAKSNDRQMQRDGLDEVAHRNANGLYL